MSFKNSVVIGDSSIFLRNLEPASIAACIFEPKFFIKIFSSAVSIAKAKTTDDNESTDYAYQYPVI